MKKTIFLSVVAGALATTAPTFILTPPARAAFFSYSASTGDELLVTDLLDQPLDFASELPKFSPTVPWEVLTAVTLSIDSEILLQNLSISNITGDTRTYDYQQERQLSVSTTDAGLAPLLNSVFGVGAFADLDVIKNGIVVDAGSTAVFTDMGATDTVSITFTDPAQLALFEGTGFIPLFANTSGSETFSGDPTDSILTSLTLAGATANILYETSGPICRGSVSPACTSIPEPSTVSAIGILGLGFLSTLGGKRGKREE